jgi:hypothetical protein
LKGFRVNKIRLLSVAFGIALTVPLSRLNADYLVYNLTDQPINVSWHNVFGISVKTKNIGPNQSKFAKTDYQVNKDTIKVYYAQDKDFKYPFLSSDAKHGILDVDSVYIHPNKIGYVPYNYSYQEPEKTICEPCKADPGALDKVKKHYKIQ